jgi:ribosomal protein S18 acetylase RimI-like enzyme
MTAHIVVDIRAAFPDDLEAIGAVAFATGFFGASAACYLPDRELFVDLWVRPYARAGCCSYVAVAAPGRVLGYLIGACEPGRYRREVARLMASRIVPGLLLGRYPQRRASAPFLARWLRRRTPAADERRFPAHLHVSLLPEARGSGTGRALLDRHLGCLVDGGVPGVQLSTTCRTAAAVRLYERCGFVVAARARSDLWAPWAGGEVEHLVMTRDLKRETTR